MSGTSTTLSAAGIDAYYPSTDLTYNWADNLRPGRGRRGTFNVNGTNAAQDTTVTVDRAGSYTFQVTITNPSDLSVTSSVTVTVAQTLTAIAVTPAPAVVIDTATQMFSASASDQFGHLLTSQPAFIWSVVSGGAGGTIATTGTYTAPTSGTGTDTVQAASGTVSGTAVVTDYDRPAFNSVTAIDSSAGSQVEGTLATFTENAPGFPVSQLTANIAWGDGTSSTGVLTFSAGVLTVSGTHTFAVAGTAPYMVQILWNTQVIASAQGSVSSVTPPVAHNDSYATASGQPLTVLAAAGVLANDEDSAGGTLMATEVAPACMARWCSTPMAASPTRPTPDTGAPTASATRPATARSSATSRPCSSV